MTPRTGPFRVPVLCTGNSARSQIAEALLATRGGARVAAASAGSRPAARVNPYAVAVLAAHGVAWDGRTPKSLDDVAGQPFDLVVTVCDNARDACPLFPGGVAQVHWGLPDPADEPEPAAARRAFAARSPRVRRDLRRARGARRRPAGTPARSPRRAHVARAGASRSRAPRRPCVRGRVSAPPGRRAAVRRRVTAEAIGTAVLVLVGPGAAMVAASTRAFGHAGVAAAFGLAVTLVVSACGGISGAHVNPAVTVAFWSAGRFPARDVAPYVAAQCAGAVAAAFALRWLLGSVGGLGATVPALSLGRSFAVEAGYSAVLAFVIFAVATDPSVPRSVPPFAIGATVAAGTLVTGPLTGGSFNPARTLGPAAAGGGFAAHWLYSVGCSRVGCEPRGRAGSESA